MTPNDTDARDIVTRCEDALKRRDMLLEHKLLQEAVREMRATRAERDALRARCNGLQFALDELHTQKMQMYAELQAYYEAYGPAPSIAPPAADAPPRETGAERDESDEGIAE